MNYILYAVPFFFLLIGIELVLERVRQTNYYRVNDAINSLSAGVLSRMIGIVKALIPLTLYLVVYDNFALFVLPDTLWIWIVAFVLYDFCYYWNHRMGHEMSLLWAAHVVHHSSEEYNLTTALRQSSSSFLSWIFYLPMALLGFDPVVLISVGSLNLIYQFWVHTRHVPKLGWFEWFFVSPSNHRVHHAQNKVYIDRNYGGVFIIWDRLFGSFQEELDEQPVIYGIRSALHSWNPLYANIQVYSQLAKDSWRTKYWKDKFQVWFGRTGWRPADVARDYPLVKTDLQQFEKFDQRLSLVTRIYSLLQYALIAVIGLSLLLNINELSMSEQLGLVFFVTFSSFTLGTVMEKRQSAVWLECVKYLVVLGVLLLVVLPAWLKISLYGLTAISLFLLWFVHKDNKFCAAEKALLT